MTQIKLGKKLKAARLSKDMSRAKLSALCNVSQPTIEAIETGKGNPTLKVLERVAGALDKELVINII